MLSGWWASVDGGKNWTRKFTNRSLPSPASGFGDAVVLGSAMHSNDSPFANTTSIPGGASFTHVEGGEAELVELAADGVTVTTRKAGRNVSYSGMPPVGCRAGAPNNPKVSAPVACHLALCY